ncbi:MAG TPA: hypothetical protein VJS15_08795, partial [Allosphingosinicella sp.]|nr:hypothetical protein [Allosphingosinicella sp.]
MSLLGRVESEAEGEIEPGKRLIRVGDDRGLSLFERLNYRLHRFAWRTPLHAFRLRGRVPLKLIAVPRDPIAGDKAAGEALLAGMFSHSGTEVPVEGFDFATLGLPADFSAWLQSFAWLRDLSAAATRERGAKRAEQVMRKWLAVHAEQVSEPAWRADLWGRRILFWTAYAPYVLSSADPVYRSSVLYALARGARHLERSADKALPGLARITAWSGVIAAALVVQGEPFAHDLLGALGAALAGRRGGEVAKPGEALQPGGELLVRAERCEIEAGDRHLGPAMAENAVQQRLAHRFVAGDRILGHRDQLQGDPAAQPKLVQRSPPGEAVQPVVQALEQREAAVVADPDQPLAGLDLAA